MLRIELGDGRLRFDLQCRKQRHGAGRGCQRHDVGDVGALEDAVRHQIIGGFGCVVDADDGDQRALPLRRLQCRDRRVGSSCAIAGGVATEGAAGSEKIQPPPITAASAMAPIALHNTRRKFMAS